MMRNGWAAAAAHPALKCYCNLLRVAKIYHHIHQVQVRKDTIDTLYTVRVTERNTELASKYTAKLAYDYVGIFDMWGRYFEVEDSLNGS